MKTRPPVTLVFLVMALLSSNAFAASPANVIDLWPGLAPGEKGNIGEEKDTTKPTDQLIAGKRVIRLGHVSRPTISFYRPPPGKDTGAAVLVCPGGGYHILAMDLEGTEVCEWLNTMGVTAVLLKYRVPKREELERHTAPLQDAQRALGLLRSRAKEYSLDPQRIGALGFSAGGHLIAALASSTGGRTYPAVDAADAASCRPDFNIVIYPGYLVLKDQGDKINPSVAVTTNHPPTFLVMAQDDPVRVENAVLYYLALKQAGVPSELHTYPTGGHGYGLRRSEHLVTSWPDRAADWMRSRGLLDRKQAFAR
jgi:acetyl esterase/lipase